MDLIVAVLEHLITNGLILVAFMKIIDRQLPEKWQQMRFQNWQRNE